MSSDAYPAILDVRCCSCAVRYVTSPDSFDKRKCKCPVCGSSKAQALPPSEQED